MNTTRDKLMKLATTGVFGLVASLIPLAAAEKDKSDWWSFKPAIRPTVLQSAISNQQSAINNPIDAFIQARLQQAELRPSPPADPLTLIRRLTYDLTGLPPTPGEVDAFAASSRRHGPWAVEQLVDRLLASPRYGERWARHWLDVVHFGETHGYDKDKLRPHAWPYRDYVIRSLNSDKPYFRFVQEQLAGDVLYPDHPDGIVALGFIAAGPWDFVGHAELPESKTDGLIARYNDRDDMVMTTFSTFQSLTVHCARCHDHKFDPISQHDYYRLQAVFAGVDRANRPYDPDPAVHRQRRRLTTELRALQSRKSEIERTLAQLSSPESKAESARLDERLGEVSKALAALPEPKLVYAAASDFKPEGSFTPPKGIRPVHLLQRGDVQRPGDLVQPGTLACVPGPDPEFHLPSDHSEGARRAALARWLTDSRNLQTRRSLVNRVWQYHFGRGLVETPNDFGHMGSPSSHPELLDWLAYWFIENGESLKKLHRLIATSATYRQVSFVEAEAKARSSGQPFNPSTLQPFNDVNASPLQPLNPSTLQPFNGTSGLTLDADNRLFWRMNRARLDAECIRDAMLFVSGQLDLAMHGPSDRQFFFKDDHSPVYDYTRFDVDAKEGRRRSVYRHVVRSVTDPFMDCLDAADPSQLVARRNTTLTALQALATLNNPFVLRQCEHFAARLERLSPEIPGQIEAAYRLALSRTPTLQEKQRLADYARQHGLVNACRLLFNSSEFMFVD